MTKVYKISAIKRKASLLGEGYLEDCMLLASNWDEKKNIARFSSEASAEIRATWGEKNARPQRPCRGCL